MVSPDEVYILVDFPDVYVSIVPIIIYKIN